MKDRLWFRLLERSSQRSEDRLHPLGNRMGTTPTRLSLRQLVVGSNSDFLETSLRTAGNQEKQRTHSSPSEEARSEACPDQATERNRPAVPNRDEGNRIAVAGQRVSGRSQSSGDDTGDGAAKR
jgi:hypothetical protein